MQIAAQNSVGLGPYANAKPEAEIPQSRPELAQKCHAYSIPYQDVSMLVEWTGADMQLLGTKFEIKDLESHQGYLSRVI